MSVYIEAPRDFCIRHTMQHMGVYDMTLNSERVGIEECVALIKSYMQIKGLIE